MIELAQLFQDMEAAVVQQEAPIEHIDAKAEDTVVHLDKGNEQLNQAVDKARSARRKKWICLGIFGKSSLKPLIIEGQWALTFASPNHPYPRGCYCYCSGGHSAAQMTWIQRTVLVCFASALLGNWLLSLLSTTRPSCLVIGLSLAFLAAFCSRLSSSPLSYLLPKIVGACLYCPTVYM